LVSEETLSCLPEITLLRLAPATFSLAGPSPDAIESAGANRIIIHARAKIEFATDPSIGGIHEMNFSLSVAATPEAIESPLPHLESLADDACAELLEAIAAEFRKRAADR
jgi:hypothetical protein